LRLNESMSKDNLANSWRKRGEVYGVRGVQTNIETLMTPREATRLVNQVKGSLNKGLGDTKGKGNEALVTSIVDIPEFEGQLDPDIFLDWL